MTLETAWQIEQTWGGNQAVLKGVVKGLKPQRIVECGCGGFSTPILRNPIGHLLSIEHDLHWARKIKKQFQEDTFHNYCTYALPGVSNGKDPKIIDSKVIQGLQDFYAEQAKDITPFDFLVVDTYRCARVPAALTLTPKTGLVMLHDVRPYSRDYYEYEKLDNLFKDWHRYEHRPEGMINKMHSIPWTALYSREELDLDKLQPFIIQESLRLWYMKTKLEEINGC